MTQASLIDTAESRQKSVDELKNALYVIGKSYQNQSGLFLEASEELSNLDSESLRKLQDLVGKSYSFLCESESLLHDLRMKIDPKSSSDPLADKPDSNTKTDEDNIPDLSNLRIGSSNPSGSRTRALFSSPCILAACEKGEDVSSQHFKVDLDRKAQIIGKYGGVPALGNVFASAPRSSVKLKATDTSAAREIQDQNLESSGQGPRTDRSASVGICTKDCETNITAKGGLPLPKMAFGGFRPNLVSTNHVSGKAGGGGGNGGNMSDELAERLRKRAQSLAEAEDKEKNK
uniref:Uncharacterized protein n=1 Tax=Polytomella parva TaxID=51329 RepID=A0A7S0YTH2_9CHLO|mmetsp:Transcript_8992/g.16972  ORF Transcript_8992/g.16972 Transcript_8992/m.16972 type:complete len:289 (+) Transcript_8992:150-1016(+)|eukprot:CAMPEP_0175040146 /NCGR_PEP_ID=MMETSP0052_2-20121109/1073_1 /TAXON_ID=51329 ORGANISM="Polytomella parva, Strain SAG 63-3" /NCGR_SAMPLE_ID=MMETSP0052_2 /ASSEMBLY_ACC=CAM_ASM_000194 /LENGTH=288 /DNA_ID=CAMNT_0016302269 /DNA_START=98 /DNA_END=964 /DNA_ORIENTATION=-